LIHGYQKIDPDLALPTLRAQMEKRISSIADGESVDQEVLKQELDLYSEKFKQFTLKALPISTKVVDTDNVRLNGWTNCLKRPFHL
jgi:DNA topoisomerase IA